MALDKTNAGASGSSGSAERGSSTSCSSPARGYPDGGETREGSSELVAFEDLELDDGAFSKPVRPSSALSGIADSVFVKTATPLYPPFFELGKEKNASNLSPGMAT